MVDDVADDGINENEDMCVLAEDVNGNVDDG